jgi:hypothetical protein
MPALIFSDLALSRRLERAEGRANAEFVEARLVALPDSGAAWTEVGGALAMFDGVGSPLTQTFGLGLDGPVSPADLDHIEQFFRDRQSPVLHEVSPLAHMSLLTLLTERGYHVIEFTSVMWRSIGTGYRDGALAATTVSARPITGDEHETWATTAAEGWNHLPELMPFLRELSRINPHRRNHVPFIAELDGTPIAAGGLAIDNGIALLAGASTIPAARRRGAQRALLDARLRYAGSAGCDIAMMGAAPGSDSQRNAERQGFRVAYTRVKWRKE